MKKIYLKGFASVLLVLLLSSPDAKTQSVIRGPYLQSPGPNSIILRWRTDSLTDSRVYYGSTLGSNTLHADSGTLTTEHRVKISGLLPHTKYFYSIGSSTQVLRGSDALLYFTTAPDPSVPTPVRFWAIGDFGHGSTEQRDVRNAYINYTAAQAHPADMQVWLGDDAYSHGTDLEYQNNVFDTVNCYGNQFLNLPFIPAPGNHDWDGVCPWAGPCNTDPNLQTGPYLNLIDPPTEGEQGGVPSHTKMFYSFDYGDIHFISLNSELGSLTGAYNWVGVFNSSTTFTSPMIDWLKADLAATTKKWKIAFFHQCPYSAQDNFTEQSTLQYFTYATRAHFNPHLEQYGVDLVLTGHDHNYQRSYLVQGLYDFKAAFNPFMIIDGSNGDGDANHAYVKYTDGPEPNKGTVYVVEGNSSESNGWQGGNFTHPLIYWGDTCATCFGSLIVDVDGDRLDGYYLTAYDSIKDHFTILKQSVNGIKDPLKGADNFNVVPNPFNSQCEATYTLSNKSHVKIDVLDMNGRVVYSLPEAVKEPGSYRDIISLEKFAAGTYSVRLNCDGKITSNKVVKTE